MAICGGSTITDKDKAYGECMVPINQIEMYNADSRSDRSQSGRHHTDTIAQRISVVEATLRVQDATGASHLQQIEQCPQAFGLESSVRPAIRRLRRKRNQALHGNIVSHRVAEIETRMEPSFPEEMVAFKKACESVGKGKGAFPPCKSCRSRPALSSPAFCGLCGSAFRSCGFADRHNFTK